MRLNINILIGLLLILGGCSNDDKSLNNNGKATQKNSHEPFIKYARVQQVVIPSDTFKRTIEIYTSIWVFNNRDSSDFDLHYYKRDSVKFEEIKQKKQTSLDWAKKKRDSLNNAFRLAYDFAKEVEFWNKNNNINPNK